MASYPVIVPSISRSGGLLQPSATLRLCISIRHKYCTPEVHVSLRHFAGSRTASRVSVVNNKLSFRVLWLEQNGPLELCL